MPLAFKAHSVLAIYIYIFFGFLFFFVFIILRLLTKHILQLQNLKLKGSA